MQAISEGATAQARTSTNRRNRRLTKGADAMVVPRGLRGERATPRASTPDNTVAVQRRRVTSSITGDTVDNAVPVDDAASARRDARGSSVPAALVPAALSLGIVVA